MTTGTGESFPTTFWIEKAVEADGRDGPQWELEVKWPWTNLYEGRFILDKLWIEQSDYPEKPAKGEHNVMVHRRMLKRKREGEHDGSQPWMYNYGLDSFGGEGHQASPNGHTGASGSQDDYRRSKEEMRWTEALHMASRLVGVGASDQVELTIEKAERLYQVLEAGYPHLESDAPGEHYCYQHQEHNLQGRTGAWGHMVEDQPCLEEQQQEAG